MDISTLYLFKEQTYQGRCLLSFRGHKSELFDLQDQELMLFAKDLKRASNALSKAFDADKINYGAYSDKLPHLHFHLVPKYEGGPSWGSTFDMMPEKKILLSDQEYMNLINTIKKNL
jgi:diadenosine tetraphosphate (Ap4A) HIT family hydrolase